jgi:hypothetical protein
MREELVTFDTAKLAKDKGRDTFKTYEEALEDGLIRALKLIV